MIQIVTKVRFTHTHTQFTILFWVCSLMRQTAIFSTKKNYRSRIRLELLFSEISTVVISLNNRNFLVWYQLSKLNVYDDHIGITLWLHCTLELIGNKILKLSISLANCLHCILMSYLFELTRQTTSIATCVLSLIRIRCKISLLKMIFSFFSRWQALWLIGYEYSTRRIYDIYIILL